MALQKEDIEQIVRNYLKSQHFQFISCNRSDLEDVSRGFLSSAEKACIRYRFREEERELSVFMKTMPHSPYRKEIIDSTGSFLREAVLFEEVLIKFHDKLQDNTLPNCLLVKPDLIVLEDMNKKGFKNKNLESTFDIPECKKTLEALAKFHSLSFVTEKLEGRKMTELVPIIKTEVLMSKEENNLGHKAGLVSIVALKKCAETFLSEEYSEEVINKAFNYMENSFEEIARMKLHPKVLSHSDMWGNNIMIRYCEDGQVQEACLIDFQLATYKPPAYDVLYFLHNCTDNKLRDKHYDELMKHYYSALSKQLSCAGIDVQDLMTWDDFQDSLKVMLPAVLSNTCSCLHFILMPEDILSDASTSDDKFRQYYEVDRTACALEAMKRPEYNRRLIEALTNFLNYFKHNK